MARTQEGIFGSPVDVWSRLRKKARYASEKPEKHTSGAKADVDFARLMPGINPRHTARGSFSASCEVVP